MTGKVYLVGAGPGDPGLLTLRAAELMQRATVIVYDRLADERILSYANPAARLIYVGKAAARHTMPQIEINQLLVDLAKDGETVVRLKGGDPFVFGRGGEEALLLAQEGIYFEIVPGISSAVAVPAYAGIPVTHRGVATSFAVVTGHEDPLKKMSGLHWDKLAQGTDTLIFLMSAANMAEIAAKLIAAGRRPDTPVALIRWGTRTAQEVIVTDLKTAPQIMIRPPMIFLVGDVVKLREKLRWFDDATKRPLWGKKVLVTRAREQASALTAKLTELGAEVTETPAIRFSAPTDEYAALDTAINNVAAFTWLIFTSANGVKNFFARLNGAGRDSRALGRTKIAAIGSATAAELVKYGIRADLVPREYRAEGLSAELTPLIGTQDNILIARAEEAREILPEQLRQTGAKVTVAAAYKTVAALDQADELKTSLAAGKIDWITFTSSSTVKYLSAHLSANDIKRAQVACIGPVTADTCRAVGIEPTVVAEEYTIDGLVSALTGVVQSERGNGI